MILLYKNIYLAEKELLIILIKRREGSTGTEDKQKTHITPEKNLRNMFRTTKISKQNIKTARDPYIRCIKKIPPRICQKYLISRISNQQTRKIPIYDAVIKNLPSISKISHLSHLKSISHLPHLKSINERKKNIYIDDN